MHGISNDMMNGIKASRRYDCVQKAISKAFECAGERQCFALKASERLESVENLSKLTSMSKDNVLKNIVKEHIYAAESTRTH